MKTLTEILDSNFVKDLIQNPKPTFLPYLKAEGPTITAENKAVMVETLMVDYLKKKQDILQQFKDYQNAKTDLEILQIFEKEVSSKIGQRLNVMHFYAYDPSKDLVEQLKNVMLLEGFVAWAIN